MTFTCLETKRSRPGPSLENTVDGATIISLIRPIWPWCKRRCEPVHFYDGRAHCSSLNGYVFLKFGIESVQSFGIVETWNCFTLLQVIDVDHTLGIPEKGSQHLSFRYDSICLLRSRFARWNPQFSYFYDGHETRHRAMRPSDRSGIYLLYSYFYCYPVTIVQIMIEHLKNVRLNYNNRKYICICAKA